MKIIIYTTTKSSWFQKEADKVAAVFAKKVPDFTIHMQHIHRPRSVDTVAYSKNDKTYVRFNWDWFTNTFPLPEGYDGVGFHFTPYYKRKWGIKGMRGMRNSRNKSYPEFFVIADRNEMAEGYNELSQFARLLFHELGHFFEDLDDEYGNTLQQSSVHITDYQLKQIHLYPLLIDYRGFVLKRKVYHVVNKVINFVTRYI